MLGSLRRKIPSPHSTFYLAYKDGQFSVIRKVKSLSVFACFNLSNQSRMDEGCANFYSSTFIPMVIANIEDSAHWYAR